MTQYRQIFADDERLLRLRDIFSDAGYELRIVGGAVRDLVLGKAPKDIDLATSATPSQMVALFAEKQVEYIPTGLQHGTITAVIEGEPYEITTLRVDTDTDGRHAQVEFTTDWQVDALRRDFTINAMSIDFEGNLFDYFGGLQDAEAHHVRFVGSAQDRIEEDYLRILRYYRFRSRIGDYQMDSDTDTAIHSTKTGLEKISGERIWAEMSKLLSDISPYTFMLEMARNGTLGHIDLPVMDYDRSAVDWFNFVRALSATENPVTRLASLLWTQEQAEVVHKRWKLSAKERDLLYWLVHHKESHVRITVPYLKKVAHHHGLEQAVETAALFGETIVLDIIRTWTPPGFPVRGRDLIDQGMTPGPQIGAMLKHLEDLWIQSDYTMTRDELFAVGTVS